MDDKSRGMYAKIYITGIILHVVTTFAEKIIH